MIKLTELILKSCDIMKYYAVIVPLSCDVMTVPATLQWLGASIQEENSNLKQAPGVLK